MSVQTSMKPTEIKSLRERFGFTQKQLAEAVGVNRTAVTLWESGHRNPSGSAEKMLAILLGMSVSSEKTRPKQKIQK